MKSLYIAFLATLIFCHAAHAGTLGDALGLRGYKTTKINLVVHGPEEAGLVSMNSETDATLEITLHSSRSLAEAIVHLPVVVRAEKIGAIIKSRSTLLNERYKIWFGEGSTLIDVLGLYSGFELSAAVGLNVGEMVVYKTNSIGKVVTLTDFQNIFNADQVGFSAIGISAAKVNLSIYTSKGMFTMSQGNQHYRLDQSYTDDLLNSQL